MSKCPTGQATNEQLISKCPTRQATDNLKEGWVSDVQVCHQRLSSAFDLLLIFLCSLIQTLTLTPPPNHALLANMSSWVAGLARTRLHWD